MNTPGGSIINLTKLDINLIMLTGICRTPNSKLSFDNVIPTGFRPKKEITTRYSLVGLNISVPISYKISFTTNGTVNFDGSGYDIIGFIHPIIYECV